MSVVAALYARVSTSQQEQEATIESQVAEVERYARERGYVLKAEYYFLDQAVSGGRLERPALDRLRDIATEGHFSVVLCLSPDRLARNYAHQWVLVDELKRVGVRVEFVNRPIATDDPYGQLLLGIEGLFAEYERAMITERLRRGKLYRIRRGELMSPTPPYGYRYIPVSEPDGGRWVPHAVEAEVVRMIFAWYTEEEGCTISQIVDRLNGMKEQAPARGRRWTYSTVQAILKQQAYTGHTYYNRTRTNHDAVGLPRRQGRGRRQTPTHELRPQEEWIAVQTPPLLSQEQWELAQERLRMNQKFAQRNNKRHFYLLRSLLVCDICGRTLAGRTSQKSVYYYCTNQGKNRHPDVEPHARSIAGNIIEPLVWEAVRNLLQNPHLIADAWANQNSSSLDIDELQRLQAQRRQLETQWTRLLDAFQEGLLEKASLRKRKNRLDAERTRLDQRIQRLQQQKQQASVKEAMLQDFTAFSQQLLETLNDPSPETKQKVIRLLIDHIVVGQDEIVIKHIIPTDDDCRLLPGHR